MLPVRASRQADHARDRASDAGDWTRAGLADVRQRETGGRVNACSRGRGRMDQRGEKQEAPAQLSRNTEASEWNGHHRRWAQSAMQTDRSPGCYPAREVSLSWVLRACPVVDSRDRRRPAGQGGPTCISSGNIAELQFPEQFAEC